MWWLGAALAGGFPSQLDRGMKHWYAGTPPSKAFKARVSSDHGLREQLREQGVTRLEFAVMELELTVRIGGERRLLRLSLDPRSPGHPAIRAAQITQHLDDRSQAIEVWRERAPAVLRLAERVYGGLLDPACPRNWRAIELPSMTTAETAEQQQALSGIQDEVCALVQHGVLEKVLLDDVAWVAFAGDQPTVVVRGELRLRPEGVRFGFAGLRSLRP